MKSYHQMSKKELLEEQKKVVAQYEALKKRGLTLDMSRGKPSSEQLDLSRKMLDCITSESSCISEEGIDCRNYGVLDGIKEAKEFIASMVDASAENVIVYGNSSLNLMYDTIARAMLHGIMGNTPWSKLDKVKFLCPVPGYDRHFAITSHFGIEMIPVPMKSTGPDMDMIERLVKEDESIKGIWCVPKYSNPQGYSYSDDTVKRFAKLKPAAKDFRIFWDNAYAIHHLYEEKQDVILNILEECEKENNKDLVYEFCSTSKITFAGGGIAGLITSQNNIKDIKKQMGIQTIGHDKMNQLRHVKFFSEIVSLKEHMKRHANILRPKFETVLTILENELSGLEIGEWNRANGGYFISFDSLEGCAKRIIALAKEAGVIMTPAGATYPNGIDPLDKNIRIAPSLPSIDELEMATKLFTVCVKLASLEKLL